MQIGIIGLPLVGKTTLFQLLTGSRLNLYQTRANSAMAIVPDPRLDYLARLHQPDRVTYARLEIIDLPGLVPGNEKSTRLFLDQVRRADALLHVVRAFPDAGTAGGAIRPLQDIKHINYELLLADLDLVEKRLQRIHEGKKREQSPREIRLLERIHQHLSAEHPVATLDLEEGEKELLQSYQFLTTKPLMLCINLEENSMREPGYTGRDEVLAWAREQNIPLVEIMAHIEKELQELDEEEKDLFMQELGIEEAGVSRICRGIFESLDHVTFFTVGDDEVKAWPVKKGTIAPRAAGKVHSDMEKGFIRAEVMAFADLHRHKTMAAVREKGLYRLEGKEYRVQDGDVIHFRFNI